MFPAVGSVAIVVVASGSLALSCCGGSVVTLPRQADALPYRWCFVLHGVACLWYLPQSLNAERSTTKQTWRNRPMARKKKAGAAKPVARSRSTRTTKDGMYVAVNVYVHRELLDQLDGEAADEDRTRRAQLRQKKGPKHERHRDATHHHVELGRRAHRLRVPAGRRRRTRRAPTIERRGSSLGRRVRWCHVRRADPDEDRRRHGRRAARDASGRQDGRGDGLLLHEDGGSYRLGSRHPQRRRPGSHPWLAPGHALRGRRETHDELHLLASLVRCP